MKPKLTLPDEVTPMAAAKGGWPISSAELFSSKDETFGRANLLFAISILV